MVPIKRAKRRHLRDAIFGQRGKGEQRGKEIREHHFEEKNGRKKGYSDVLTHLTKQREREKELIYLC